MDFCTVECYNYSVCQGASNVEVKSAQHLMGYSDVFIRRNLYMEKVMDNSYGKHGIAGKTLQLVHGCVIIFCGGFPKA